MIQEELLKQCMELNKTLIWIKTNNSDYNISQLLYTIINFFYIDIIHRQYIDFSDWRILMFLKPFPSPLFFLGIVKFLRVGVSVAHEDSLDESFSFLQVGFSMMS